MSKEDLLVGNCWKGEGGGNTTYDIVNIGLCHDKPLLQWAVGLLVFCCQQVMNFCLLHQNLHISISIMILFIYNKEVCDGCNKKKRLRGLPAVAQFEMDICASSCLSSLNVLHPPPYLFKLGPGAQFSKLFFTYKY